MPYNNKGEWYLCHYNISCKRFVQNACQGFLCYNDHTYKMPKWKAVLKYWSFQLPWTSNQTSFLIRIHLS